MHWILNINNSFKGTVFVSDFNPGFNKVWVSEQYPPVISRFFVHRWDEKCQKIQPDYDKSPAGIGLITCSNNNIKQCNGGNNKTGGK